MINLDFKDILAKMKDSKICDSETEFHQDFGSFSKKFPETLKKYGIRVLKTNYGSTGEGVYLVKVNEDGTITQTEAVNNEKENFSNLEEFMKNFEKNFEEDDEDAVYFKGKKGFVECRYLPRISEGEIRILLVNDKPVSVVDKKPSEGNFSATLFSGAQYSYESPEDEKRKEIVDLTKESLEKDVKQHLNGFDFPLLWTMDFIRDFDENGKTKFILSEINCSCVGITTQMELADDVAKVFA